MAYNLSSKVIIAVQKNIQYYFQNVYVEALNCATMLSGFHEKYVYGLTCLRGTVKLTITSKISNLHL